jgi:hypothetical protein
MGILVSKSAVDDESRSSHLATSKQQPSTGSPAGACPSNRVFPKSSGPLIVDDLESRGTESSRGSPDSSYNGQGDAQRPVRRYPPATDDTPSRTSWLSWRDFTGTPKQSSSISSDYYVEDLAMDHPSKIYILSPRHDSRNRTESVPMPKPVQHDHHSQSHSSIPSRGSRSLEDDDSERLQTLYDLRTWALYLRITEARQKQTTPTSSHRIAHASQSGRPSEQDVSLYQQSQPYAMTMDANHESSHGHSFIFGELE